MLRRLEVSVQQLLYCTSNNVEVKMAGTSGRFGGSVVPHSVFCDRIENEPRVKCTKKLGEAAIVHSHNSGIVGQFVPQIATWKVKNGGKH